MARLVALLALLALSGQAVATSSDAAAVAAKRRLKAAQHSKIQADASAERALRAPLGAPGQPFGAPGQPFGAPGQHLGAPGQSLGAPGQSLGAPGQPLEAPGQHLGAPDLPSTKQAAGDAVAPSAPGKPSLPGQNTRPGIKGKTAVKIPASKGVDPGVQDQSNAPSKLGIEANTARTGQKTTEVKLSNDRETDPTIVGHDVDRTVIRDKLLNTTHIIKTIVNHKEEAEVRTIDNGKNQRKTNKKAAAKEGNSSKNTSEKGAQSRTPVFISTMKSDSAKKSKNTDVVSSIPIAHPKANTKDSKKHMDSKKTHSSKHEAKQSDPSENIRTDSSAHQAKLPRKPNVMPDGTNNGTSSNDKTSLQDKKADHGRTTGKPYDLSDESISVKHPKLSKVVEKTKGSSKGHSKPNSIQNIPEQENHELATEAHSEKGKPKHSEPSKSNQVSTERMKPKESTTKIAADAKPQKVIKSPLVIHLFQRRNKKTSQIAKGTQNQKAKITDSRVQKQSLTPIDTDTAAKISGRDMPGDSAFKDAVRRRRRIDRHSNTVAVISIFLISSVTFVTILGVYYKKISFSRQRYGLHMPLSSHDDDYTLFNRDTQYESWAKIPDYYP